MVRRVASFQNNTQIKITDENNTEIILTSKYSIIATGSKPATIRGVGIDKQRIISSTEALSLKTKPESIVIIGGGVIGVEMASIFARIGVAITVIEYMNNLIPAMDSDLRKELKKILVKTGVSVLLNHKVLSVVNKGNHVHVKYLDTRDTFHEIKADYCLIAVGRKPYTTGLGLENTRIVLDEKGRIKTDKQLRTAEVNIYAIGDVIDRPMVAHKAEEDGVFVAETIHGQKTHLNYLLIPNVV